MDRIIPHTQDARKRNACILYATHIFDGLEDWLDSVAFVSRGKLQFLKQEAELPEIKKDGLLATVSGCVTPLNPMLGICCTLLHTDGLLLVAQQCCIRWALLHTCARETCPTHPVGNTSTNAQLGCRSLGHTVSRAARRLLCCFVLQTIGVFACCKQCVHW